MPSKRVYRPANHRIALNTREGNYLAAAAALEGMTPKAWVERELLPIAHQIVESDRPLSDAAVLCGPLKAGQVRWISIEPNHLRVVNRAIRVERRAIGHPGAAQFTLKQFTEKYLLPLACETIKRAAREMIEPVGQKAA